MHGANIAFRQLLLWNAYISIVPRTYLRNAPSSVGPRSLSCHFLSITSLRWVPCHSGIPLSLRWNSCHRGGPLSLRGFPSIHDVPLSLRRSPCHSKVSLTLRLLSYCLSYLPHSSSSSVNHHRILPGLLRLGPLMGGPQCRLSILINCNVPCRFF